MRKLLIGLVMAGACLWTSAAGEPPPAPVEASPAPRPPATRGQVVLPSGRVLEVEVAATPEKQALGYMFREAISDQEGMLFIHDQVGFHSFWMKNCRVPLDILWIDEKWRVVHIAPNLPPCKEDPCPSYQPIQASLYALEMQAGLAGKEGLKLGDHVIFTPSAR